MNKKLLALVSVIALLAAVPMSAVSVWFSSAPNSADHGAGYYVEARTYITSWWEGGDLWLYKNSNYVSGNGGAGTISAGTWQTDNGPQSIEYFAEAWDWGIGENAMGWHYVYINPPANQPPMGICDYSQSSVPLGANLQGNGWAADNEMGAPITRVDILVDGVDVGDASLGGYRPDVASFYGRSEFTNSGWSFSWSTGGLPAGTHSLEFRAWDNQGASSTFGYRTFTVTNYSPSITLLSPSAQTVNLGTTLSLSSRATDPDGNITHHHLDIQRPDGAWNWQGAFANGEPYNGGPVGSAADSTRTANFTFNQLGTWYVRSWVNDANGNSLHSATVAIVVTDQSAPSTPTDLSSSSVTPISFTLSWSASSDNVGVTAYQVFRDTTNLGETASLSMSVTGLTGATTYGMKVRARDAASNWSGWSGVLNVTTATPAPTITSNATWSIPQGAVVNPYQITATGSPTSYGLTGTLPTGLSFSTSTGRISGTASQSGTFSVTISATGASGTGSVGLAITVVAGGLTTNATLGTTGTGTVNSGRLHVKPTDIVTLQPGGTATLGVSWTENKVLRPNSTAKTHANQIYPNHFSPLSYTPDNGSGQYSYQMRLVDNGQNIVDQHVEFVVDGTAPSIPTGLTAGSVGHTDITLTWSAAIDDNAVTGYEIFRGGTSVGTTASTTFNVSGLTAGTSYSMTVRSRDAAGNWSAQTSAINVATTSDTTAPTKPAGLMASPIGTNSFTLSWNASTDNVGVTAYEVFKGGQSIGSPSPSANAATMVVTGVAANTTYSMTVQAIDGAGNRSAMSDALSVTTAYDPNGDDDADGLTNLTENLLGTNPSVARQIDSDNSTQLNLHRPKNP